MGNVGDTALLETLLSKKIIAGEIRYGDVVKVEPGAQAQGFTFETRASRGAELEHAPVKKVTSPR